MHSYILQIVYIKEKSTHNKELLNCAVLWISFLLKVCCSLKYLYMHVHIQVSSNSSMQNIKQSWLLHFRCKLQHWEVMWHSFLWQLLQFSSIVHGFVDLGNRVNGIGQTIQKRNSKDHKRRDRPRARRIHRVAEALPCSFPARSPLLLR